MRTNDHPRYVTLPGHPHQFGLLTVAQAGASVPFEPVRVYWITGIPADARRGGHAHRLTTELLVCVSGAVRVRTADRQGQRRDWQLDDPGKGLLIPAATWRDLDRFEDGSVLLVLASGRYDEDEYIREAGLFFDAGVDWPGQADVGPDE